MRASKDTNELVLIVALLTMAMVVDDGRAGTVIYEPFDQAAGSTLDGVAGGAGLGSYTRKAGSDDVIDAGSLSYGTLPTSGNYFHNPVESGYVNSHTGLSGPLDDGATLWFSIVVRPLYGSNARGGILLGTDYYRSAQVAIENSGSGVGIHLQNGSDLEILTVTNGVVARNRAQNNLSLVDPTFVVLEMVWGDNAAAPDTVNLYLPGTDLAKPAIKDTSTVVVDQTQFSLLSISASHSNAYDYDEIRFGTSYDDVIHTTSTKVPGTLLIVR